LYLKNFKENKNYKFRINLELIIKNRLERFIKLEYLIPESQYGFRRNKSCENCIALGNLEIYRIFMSGEFVPGY